jgi:hypothetical protein
MVTADACNEKSGDGQNQNGDDDHRYLHPAWSGVGFVVGVARRLSHVRFLL